MVYIIATMRKLNYLSSFSGSTYAQWLISQFDLLECSRSSFGKKFALDHPVWGSEEDRYNSAKELLLENAMWGHPGFRQTRRGWVRPNLFRWRFPMDIWGGPNKRTRWLGTGDTFTCVSPEKNWYQNKLKSTGESSILMGYAYSQPKLLPKCIRFRLILQSNSSKLLASICNRVLEIHKESTEVHRYLAAA